MLALPASNDFALTEPLRGKRPERLPELLQSVVVSPTELRVTLSYAVIAEKLGVDHGVCASEFLSFVVPLNIRRRGVETRIAIGDLTPRPDPVLLRTLA